MSPRGPTLSRILSRRATEQGEDPAHITLDRELRFRTWDEESSAVASGLKQLGVARGEVVGLAFDGHGWLELAVAYIGVHRAGATCLLMSHAASPAELRAQVSMLGARVVISNTRETLPFPELSIEVQGIKEMAVTGGRDTHPASEEVADIIFTSGTTGSSRAVACTHANVAYESRHRGGAIPACALDGYEVGELASSDAIRPVVHRDRELRVCAHAQQHHIRARGAFPVRASVQPILIHGSASEPSSRHPRPGKSRRCWATGPRHLHFDTRPANCRRVETGKGRGDLAVYPWSSIPSLCRRSAGCPLERVDPDGRPWQSR